MTLIMLVGLDPSEDRRDFLNLLTRYYIKARYPEEKEKLSKDLDKKRTTGIFQKTKECFSWLRKESGI